MSEAIRVTPLQASPPAFRSGRDELDDWLTKHGLAATQAGSARVYLAHDGGALVGYFGLAAGAVDPAHAGTRTRRGMPRHHWRSRDTLGDRASGARWCGTLQR